MAEDVLNGKKMIKYIPFSMFDAFSDPDVQTVVNTTNCMGIMGKGLALEFKIRFPEMFEDYVGRFKSGNLNPNEPYLYKTKDKWIVNFPTKNHWRYPSRLEFVDGGLKYFIQHYKEWGVKSIAFPRLGCTSGGLKWEQVKPVMEKHLSNLDGVEIRIYLDDNCSEKENQIIRLFNELNKSKIKEAVKLTDKQIDSLISYIQNKGSLKRIRDLLEIKGIGPAAYKKAIGLGNVSKIQQQGFLF